MTLKFPGIRAVSKLELIFKSENICKGHRKQSVIYLCCLEFGKRLHPTSWLSFMPLSFSKTEKKRILKKYWLVVTVIEIVFFPPFSSPESTNKTFMGQTINCWTDSILWKGRNKLDSWHWLNPRKWKRGNNKDKNISPSICVLFYFFHQCFIVFYI